MRQQKRLIFGDEDIQALQSLQRHAKVLQEDWEVVFLGSGQAILQDLALRSCDVLIASANLPDTTPESLMREARRRQPACIRILLTGSQNPSGILPCVGLIHQAFPRTRDPHQVRAMVTNAVRMGEAMARSPEVKAAVTAMEQLPSVPKIYQELRTTLEGEHATWRSVGAVIQRDVGMTAKVLKLINSAFFGLQRRVESPQEAVHFLGMEVVQALVLAYGLFEQTGSLETQNLSLEDVWSHSLQVAKGARALAAMEGLNRHQKADAFMGGLLHDAGILVLAKAFPAAYDQVLARCEQEGRPLVEVEQEAFGLTHADVGAYLLGLWGIQTGVLEAVSLHHTPSAIRHASFDHVLAVHLADEFTRGQGGKGPWEHSVLDEAALHSLGMMECIPGWKEVLKAPGW